MKVVIALLYIAAVILLFVAALPVRSYVKLALMGAACGLLAFGLPFIQAGFSS